MQMSDSEIRWRYKQSKDKDIIKKLAELNACPVCNIEAIICKTPRIINYAIQASQGGEYEG